MDIRSLAMKLAAVAFSLLPLVLAPAGASQAAEPTGAGSTFVAPILAKWANDYQAKTGKLVRYQSIGSGGGITKIKAAAVDFGASDMPMKPDELQKLGMAQFPLVIGGVVPVINIDGIKSGQVRFTGSLLADIFLGKVKTWNDPAIRNLNPDVKLPAAPIVVVYRLDGSGTTFNWVNYLSKVSPEWRARVGEGTSVEWPIGAGGKGNEGVALYVSQTPNSIGYVEYAFVVRNKMTYALVQNAAGRFVAPGRASFQAAAASADWVQTRDFYLVMTDAPGEGAYPITATTFVLMPKNPANHDNAKAAIEFFRWALEAGQAQAEALDYVPLPATLVEQIEKYWRSAFSGGAG
jgi:phosphate transport system substrate-binding protein